MKKVISYILVLTLVVVLALSVGNVAMADVSISTSVKVNPATLPGPGTVAVTVSIKNNGDPIYNVKLTYPQPTGSVIELGDMDTGATKEHVNNSWNISADMLDKAMAFTVSYTTMPGAPEQSGSTPSVTISKQAATVKVTGTAASEQKEVEKGTKVKFTFDFKNESNVKVDNAYLKASPLNGGDQLGQNFSMDPGGTKHMEWSATINEDTTVKPVLTYAVQGKQYTLNVDPVSVKVKTSESQTPVGGSLSVDLAADKMDVAAGDTVNFTLNVANTGSSTLSNVTAKDFDGNDVALSASTLAKGESATGSTGVAIMQTGNYSFNVFATDDSGNDVTVQSNAISITVAEAEPSPEQVDPNSIIKTDVSLSGTTISKPDEMITATFKVTNLSDQELKNIVVYDDTVGTLGVQPTLAAGSDYSFEKQFTLKESATLVFQTSADMQDGTQVQIQTPEVPITVVETPEAGGPNWPLIIIVCAIGAVAAFLIWYLLKNKKGGSGGKPAPSGRASYGGGSGGRPQSGGRPPQRPAQQQRPQQQRPQQQRPPQQRYSSDRDYNDYDDGSYREPQQPARQQPMPQEPVEPRPAQRPQQPARRSVGGGSEGGPKSDGSNGNGPTFGDRNKF